MSEPIVQTTPTTEEMINYIREKLGGIKISCGIIEDWPQDGQKGWGWCVWGMDEKKVAEYEGHYWGPGSGPHKSMEEALDSVYYSLIQAIRVVDGKAGFKHAETAENGENEAKQADTSVGEKS